MTASHAGGCLCGAIRYRVTGAPLSSVICHCVSCRRASGAPTVAWIEVDRKGFEFIAGEPAAFRSSPGVVRRFCGTCGSALTYEAESRPGSIDVTTGTLDAPHGFPPTAEVWLDDRVHWQSADPTRRHFAGSSAE
jgi:hypothetical protein